MKDKASAPQGRFRCPLYADCLLWSEYLELPVAPREEPLEDLTAQELQLVQKLQQHLPTCPECAALVRREREQRAWQRSALKGLLHEGEEQVPSTQAAILSALRQEQRTQASGIASELQVEGTFSAEPLSLRERPRRENRQTQRFRASLALIAAVALVTLGFGLFHQILSLQHSAPAARVVHAPLFKQSPTRVVSSAWNSLVITRPAPDGKSLLIENYDPQQKRSENLLPGCCSLNTQIDSISHAGDDLLYHQQVAGQTRYTLLSGPTFTLNGQGGNAIWSTDDHFIYTFVGQQLWQYATQQQQLQALSFTLPVVAAHLQFYYQHYLYFSVVQSNVSTYLYRVNLETGEAQSLVGSLSSTSDVATFWLSPLGNSIYYVNAVNGVNSIFAINLDGTNPRLVATNALPMGYAADSTLIALREVHGAFQLVELTSSPQVLVHDLAPGASLMPSANVALAPYAGNVVAAGVYADGGSLKFWLTQIQAHTQQVFLQIPGSRLNGAVHLVGWDRLQVPPETR